MSRYNINVQMNAYMHSHRQQLEIRLLKSLQDVFHYFSVYYSGDVVKW